ncbi:hypothetical protein [Photobacterium lipolyticum]|uniref:Uncharacterized protein n=1 Tax=Photobacterium lipolyticum TaxID=266810 RepID=A0A2T3N1I5_9GAMM|nr:hypothetical protein [Photobacterium lipolyticum]PSW06162.1 hypothetical protein C9I89_06540 [Photobacterium lipolyticum]
MASLGYCKIDDLKLSANSSNAISEISDLIGSGNMLSIVTSTIPLFQIFLSPGKGTAFEATVSIREYDWELFGNALSATGKITRSRIFNVAYSQEFYTYGKEQEFWRCVSEASK